MRAAQARARAPLTAVYCYIVVRRTNKANKLLLRSDGVVGDLLDDRPVDDKLDALAVWCREHHLKELLLAREILAIEPNQRVAFSHTSCVGHPIRRNIADYVPRVDGHAK